jgi:hypothetical protein
LHSSPSKHGTSPRTCADKGARSHSVLRFHVHLSCPPGSLSLPFPNLGTPSLERMGSVCMNPRAARTSRAAFRPRAMAGSGWPWPDGRTAMASGHHLPTSNYGVAKVHATTRIKGRTRCPQSQSSDRRPCYLRSPQTSSSTPAPYASTPRITPRGGPPKRTLMLISSCRRLLICFTASVAKT